MNLAPLVVIVGLTLLVAVSGSLLTTPQITTWYATLNLPSWTPPGSLIGLAWTTIFILTAIAAMMVWKNAPRDSRLWWIILLFLLNGALNVFWSYLFFSQHLLGTALLEMFLLNASTVALVVLIWPINRLASALLLPYVGWVTFATYLAYSVWQLNN